MTGLHRGGERPDPGLPGTTSRVGLLAGLALGLPVLAYGVRGALVDAADTRPAELARWAVGLAVVNDLVVLPAAMLVARVLRRAVPGRAWPAVRTGALCTAVLAAVGWPLVRGYGEDPHDPSLLPRNYGAGLAAAVGAVWIGVGLWWALGARPGRPERRR